MKYLAHAIHLKAGITVTRHSSREIDLGDGRTDSTDDGESEVDLDVSGTVTPGEEPCDGMQWRQTGRGPMPSSGCDPEVELDRETEARLIGEAEVERAKDALFEAYEEERHHA